MKSLGESILPNSVHYGVGSRRSLELYSVLSVLEHFTRTIAVPPESQRAETAEVGDWCTYRGDGVRKKPKVIYI